MNKFYNYWKGSNLSTKVCGRQMLMQSQLARVRVKNTISRFDKGENGYFPIKTDFGTAIIDKQVYTSITDNAYAQGHITPVTVVDEYGRTTTKSITTSKLYDSFLEEMDVANLELESLDVITNISVNEGSIETAAVQLLSLADKATTSAGQAYSRVMSSLVNSASDVAGLLSSVLEVITPKGETSKPFITPTIGSITGTTGLSLFFDSADEAITSVITQAVNNMTSWFNDVVDFAALYAPGAFQALTKEISYAVRSSFTWKVLRQGLPLACYFGDPGYLDPVIQVNSGLSTDDPSMNFMFGQYAYRMSSSLKDAMIQAGCTDGATYCLPTLGATWYFTLIADEGHYMYPGTFCYAPHLYEPQCADVLSSALKTANVPGDDITEWNATDAASYFDARGYMVVPFFKSFGEYISPGQLNYDVYHSYRDTCSLIPYGVVMLHGDSDFSEFILEHERPTSATGDVILDAFLPSGSLEGETVSGVTQETRSNVLQFIANSEVTLSEPVLLWLDAQFTTYFFKVAEGDAAVSKAFFPVDQPLVSAFTIMSDSNYFVELTNQAQSFASTVAAIALVATSIIASIALTKRYREVDREYNLAFYDSSISTENLRKLRIKRDILFVASGASLYQWAIGAVNQSSSDTKEVIDEAIAGDIPGDQDYSLNDIARLIAGSSLP